MVTPALAADANPALAPKLNLSGYPCPMLGTARQRPIPWSPAQQYAPLPNLLLPRPTACFNRRVVPVD